MRIKDLREDHNFTQEEVARYLHIKQNTYSQYENGQRQLPLLRVDVYCIRKTPP